MKTGLNCEQPFDEWSRDIEHKVTTTVIQLFHDTISSTDTTSTMVHETMVFILEEAGICPEILQMCEFIFSDDPSDKGGS